TPSSAYGGGRNHLPDRLAPSRCLQTTQPRDAQLRLALAYPQVRWGLSNVMLPPLALVLMWNVSCTPIREPSGPGKTALKVLVAAPFCMLPCSPNQLAKWPEALASALLSGTNVIVPCAAPVRWNVPLASVVRWKTPVLAVPVTVPGAPVQGFTSWSLK